VWHLTIPFITLLLVFLWRSPLSAFAVGPGLRRLAFALIVLASVTRLFGLLPEGSLVAAGWVNGTLDVVRGVRPASHIATRTHSILEEVTHPRQGVSELAVALASPERHDRPVMLYGDLWAKGIHLGVCPAGYATYKLMYTNAYRPVTDFLERNPRTLVIVDRATYGELFEGEPVAVVPTELSTVKRATLWLSSRHWAYKDDEQRIRRQVWRQNLGEYLVRNYRRSFQTVDDVVLERR
jgi:hypothetical protein